MRTKFNAKVVGLSFVDGYPDNILALNEMAEGRDLENDPIPVALVRDVHPKDPNAIEVHVPDLEKNTRIGYLPKKTAAMFARNLDRGEIWDASIYAVLVHPDFPENPGIDLRVVPVSRDDEPF